MSTLHYANGQPIELGDLVRRSAAARTLYRVDQLRPDGVGLQPATGYTHASAITPAAIAKLVLVARAGAR